MKVKAYYLPNVLIAGNNKKEYKPEMVDKSNLDWLLKNNPKDWFDSDGIKQKLMASGLIPVKLENISVATSPKVETAPEVVVEASEVGESHVPETKLLDDMSDDELLQLAKDNNIDLGQARKRDTIVKKIKKALPEYAK